MKTTRYFREQSVPRRPYLLDQWIERVLASPLATEEQADGLVRFWGTIEEWDDRAIRVVTLADRETVVTAFPDRNFRRRQRRELDE